MEDITNVIELTEFGTFHALDLIFRRCLTLREDYWHKVTKSDQFILLIQFKTKEEQDSTLREIYKELNNATVPSVELLNKLPKFHTTAQRSITYYKDIGVDNKELEDAIKESKKDNNRLVILYSPLDSIEHTTSYFIIKLDKNETILSVNDADEIKRYLICYWNLTIDISDKNLFPVSLYFFNKKLCALCDKPECHLKCSVCRITYYCSKEHQTSDWKNHKNYCPDLRLLKFISSQEVSKM